MHNIFVLHELFWNAEVIPFEIVCYCETKNMNEKSW